MQRLYDEWDNERRKRARPNAVLSAMQALRAQRSDVCLNGFDRMATCRRALEALDKQVTRVDLKRSLFN